ncbi:MULTISPECIES: hypothetical protein [Vibrio]|jgi:response regulator of citrate/malate metabolism|uniref:Uncharacterized protein n=2 Tax=Vibrio TaxID=662 RepID=A0A2S9ZPM7_9VIBR|nr:MULTISPECIES: hypothetical protein [Vibrio]AYV22114.1 hypothetical protein ECB94_12990 [Vibrio mediterranei]MCG9623409.1 hypothetical protein [Vibrio mediterranei]MCG9660042.1 hypothetical protein [Vibrio mediterranei]MCG9664501.1 hypothetical protein [Vibrio mediterranei]MCG9786069.1 hypothetical protein [Vibrio mediterranei]
MDKELLARKLYDQRVSELVGDSAIDQHELDELWNSKVSPSQAAEQLKQSDNVIAPGWLTRYLNKH